ncbi:NAD(P)-binding protein [Thelephora ganbajun]|uniref:NAD(P)-binding protein n=1 Tax=Thelephora ganbajun TaxID=370292 RepID=A0ACB6ZI46_THEGA|nr:NAD(P)-binding protein [Thelephora ganbajun]
MTSLNDEQLLQYGEGSKGKVVLVTGAASGIGKETALVFARFKAKLVLGDLNTAGIDEVVTQIRKSGGEAVGQRCDVTNWDSQLALFELGISAFGAIDVVIANAGINEAGTFFVSQVVDGKPRKPATTTLDVNINGVIYSTSLALHYLELNRASPSDLKAIVVMGSMASWMCIAAAPMYTASKHAVLGFARSVAAAVKGRNIRVNIIHPFFSATGILNAANMIFLAGFPMVPINRIAVTTLYAATHPDLETTGSVFALIDDGPVLLLENEIVKGGVYDILSARAASLST